MAINLKNYDFFAKSIEPIFLTYLTDRASGVRNSGASTIPSLAKVFGDQWVSTFIPKLD